MNPSITVVSLLSTVAENVLAVEKPLVAWRVPTGLLPDDTRCGTQYDDGETHDVASGEFLLKGEARKEDRDQDRGLVDLDPDAKAAAARDADMSPSKTKPRRDVRCVVNDGYDI